MDDQVAMRVFHRVAHLEKQAQTLLNPQLSRIAIAIQGFTFHIFHHQVWIPRGRNAAVEELGDMGMAERRQHAPLVLKLAEEFLARQMGGEHLDGYLLLNLRSEERRVGKECRSRWSPDH